MARKKKRRPRAPAEPTPGAPSPRGEPSSARRERKEEARRLREEARRRVRRRRALRRGLVGAGVATAVVAVVVLIRATSPGSIPAEARAAAETAGCSGVSSPAGHAPGGQHLQPGESFTYDQRPATSGFHDPSTLPRDRSVYEEPVPETQAVHNLEHAYVILYYRADGDGALDDATVSRLADLAEREDKVLLAPYPDLPDGAALALTAWNKLQTCPSTITAADAVTVASGFIEAFRGTRNAPEAFAD
jgi:hypothetical protein